MSVLRTLAVAATAVVVTIPVAGATAAQAGTQAGTTHTAANAAAVTVARTHTSYLALTGGSTRLTLDEDTGAALTSNHVAVAPASEATAGKAGISFPITGGLLNGATLAGTVNHSGGLVFSAGGKSLTIRDFEVSPGTETLTAWVDQLGARIPVLRLHLDKAWVRSTKNHLTVSRVTATLRGGAAKALNGYFSTKLFTKGLPIGTVRVRASVKVLEG